MVVDKVGSMSFAIDQLSVDELSVDELSVDGLSPHPINSKNCGFIEQKIHLDTTERFEQEKVY